jgi:glycine/D-amino acid oxidase-like deaminating enzyme
MTGRYHPALMELLRAAEAGELSRSDLEAVEQATSKRLDFKATLRSGGGWLDRSEVARGFFRALRRAMHE